MCCTEIQEGPTVTTVAKHTNATCSMKMDALIHCTGDDGGTRMCAASAAATFDTECVPPPPRAMHPQPERHRSNPVHDPHENVQSGRGSALV